MLDQATGERGFNEYSWMDDDEQNQDFEVALYGFNKDTIDAKELKKAKRNVQKVKDKLDQEGPDAKVVVNGHTCPIGSRSYNLSLSEKRARNYADLLKANGVSEDRLVVVGRGKEMLVVAQGTRDELAPNRRVELKVETDVRT